MTARHHRTQAPSPIRAPPDDLCLSFANTLAWRGSPAPSEALGGFSDLLDWLAAAGQGRSAAWSEAAGWSRRHPQLAARLFAQAIALREAIFRCCFAVASGNAVPDADLDILNGALAIAPQRRCLVRDRGVYAWSAPGAAERGTASAAALLAPVLWSAADLLAGAERLRVRRCANDACLWLFIDRSKAGTRRWCDMAACGNRAKAQRHYRRSQPA
jgi:predicted RNA-binding Zn ribbon-like protein